jgi:hypothetical protein
LKEFFWAFKILLPPFGRGEKNFFVNFKCYDLANNEIITLNYARFGGDVDIEVTYKILRLEKLNEAPNLLNSPCFQ